MLNKKIFFLILSWFFLSLISFSLAQDTNSLDSGWTWNIRVEANVVFDKSQDNINFIDAWFCDSTNEVKGSLKFSIKQLEKKELCLFFQNTANQNIKIKIWFGVWLISDIWSKTCNVWAFKNDEFYKFVNLDSDELVVPAKWNIIKLASLAFPLWINWIINWCLYYMVIPDPRGISDEQAGGATMFINVYRWKPIDVLVNDVNDKLTWSIDFSAKPHFDEEKNVNITFSLNNSWLIDQSVKINWTISNIFGFKRSFSLPDQIIKANSKIWLTWNLGKLPFYKWLFTIKLTINYKPYFDFDVSNSWLDPKVLEWWNLTQSTSLFFFPRLVVGIIIIFIVLIRLAFLRKPKVVYIETSKK